ncbi:unnamed protein product [Protopolystoma xenopodis]|uniref:Uncharacterized protein n=1 Tax=Protopolystoma xenopodis TaxID=117903 RepID=A0A448WQU0_9PLAT|nr:unnamed protein product [Protopolystoma xenopodis]
MNPLSSVRGIDLGISSSNTFTRNGTTNLDVFDANLPTFSTLPQLHNLSKVSTSQLILTVSVTTLYAPMTLSKLPTLSMLWTMSTPTSRCSRRSTRFRNAQRLRGTLEAFEVANDSDVLLIDAHFHAIDDRDSLVAFDAKQAMLPRLPPSKKPAALRPSELLECQPHFNASKHPHLLDIHKTVEAKHISKSPETLNLADGTDSFFQDIDSSRCSSYSIILHHLTNLPILPGLVPSSRLFKTVSRHGRLVLSTRHQGQSLFHQELAEIPDLHNHCCLIYAPAAHSAPLSRLPSARFKGLALTEISLRVPLSVVADLMELVRPSQGSSPVCRGFRSQVDFAGSSPFRGWTKMPTFRLLATRSSTLLPSMGSSCRRIVRKRFRIFRNTQKNRRFCDLGTLLQSIVSKQV